MPSQETGCELVATWIDELRNALKSLKRGKDFEEQKNCETSFYKEQIYISLYECADIIVK